MQISMVFNQVRWPGAVPAGDRDGKDTDDCWVVASVQAANVTAPWLPLYGIKKFRRAAGNPDDPNVADGGNINQITKALKALYPSIAKHIRAHRGVPWTEFDRMIDAGRPCSVALDSSRLPTTLQFGFKGRHQTTFARRAAGGYWMANPLAPPYSRWLHVTEEEIRPAIMHFGRLVSTSNSAWFVSLPTDAEARATLVPMDETPFDQDDIDAATAALQAKIDAAREALQ